jgi:aminopeptidase N
VEEYISRESKIDFSKVFEQYLRNTSIPTLEYKIDGYAVAFRYTNCISGFTLPVKVKFGEAADQTRWITPTTSWQTLSLADWYNKETFTPDPNFYINTKYVE